MIIVQQIVKLNHAILAVNVKVGNYLGFTKIKHVQNYNNGFYIIKSKFTNLVLKIVHVMVGILLILIIIVNVLLSVEMDLNKDFNNVMIIILYKMTGVI